MKIAINKCYGGFSFSLEAVQYMAKRKHPVAVKQLREYNKGNRWIQQYLKTGEWPKAVPDNIRSFLAIDAKYFKSKRFYGSAYDYERNDPLVIEAIDVLGDKANGECAKLKIVEIPDNIQWAIDEYDGMEHVEQVHETWG